MSRNISSALLIPILIFVFLCFSSPCLAVFNLTATPQQGGFDLRFGRISPGDFKVSQELTLSVVSDIGKQYRVEQQIIQPLSTPDGVEVPADQFKMYALVNSNSRGTLIYRQETPVSQFDRVLYTSEATGDNDSFKLIYTITPKQDQIPGSYYGRIAYVLIPMDSITQQQVVFNLNVYIDLAAGATPVVELTTSSGANRLVLTSKGMGGRTGEVYQDLPSVSVRVHGPLGTAYRVYQNIEGGAARSGIGEEFDLSQVSFAVSGGEKGFITREGNLRDAANNKQLLYVSDANGSQDEFTINYKPGKDFKMQKADNYRGRLQFIIETDRGEGSRVAAPQALDLEFDAVQLFDIYVFSGGREGFSLNFGEVTYRTGPKTSESEVFVDSNVGRPYRIVQRVSGSMINESGDKIPPEDFTVVVKDVDSTESPKSYLSESIPVKEGESVIFASGPSGKSARFKVAYRLAMRQDAKAGNYSTRIGYSLVLD